MMPTPEASSFAASLIQEIGWAANAGRKTREMLALAFDRFAAQRGADVDAAAGSADDQGLYHGAPPQTGVDCPRAKSDMTPCVLRDGELAADDRGCCVGCGERIDKSAPQTGGGAAPY